MFTGLIESQGTIRSLHRVGSAAELEVEAPIASELHVGQSIAVDGVCLTVQSVFGPSFSVTAVEETLRRTTLGGKKERGQVNLERSLRVGDRLDGHLVQGHVDGLATVAEVRETLPGRELHFTLEPDLHRFLAEKGSVALDGVSLTVSKLTARGFHVALVPVTLERTTLSTLRPGRRVNLEIDVLARYAARLLQGETSGRAFAY